MLHTIDMRGAFLNAEFTAADKPIYLRINMDVAPYWILQDPQAAPYVSQHGELVLLLDRFLYRLKQLPLKFQLHLTKTLTWRPDMSDVAIHQRCLSLVQAPWSQVQLCLDPLRRPTTLLQLSNNGEFKQHLITIYSYIQYHDDAK